MKKPAVLFLLAVLSARVAFSQEFSFNILPTAINPAFTGLFDGRVRATALLKRQWSAARPSFMAYGASADGRIDPKKSGYFALGLAALDGRAADNSFRNSSGFASVAYHKLMGSTAAKAGVGRSDLAAGVQLGYIQRNITIPQFRESFLPNVHQIGAGAQYLVLNVGLSFSHLPAKNFAYTIGLSGNNLNLFDDGTVNVQHPLLKITPSYTGLLAANWKLTNRFAIRPAALHLIGTSFYVVGNEFRYNTSKADALKTVFATFWYRSTHIISANAGYEFKYYRISAGVDHYLSAHHPEGSGGFQLVARYIMPRQKKPAEATTAQ
ncbi:type IX secretion system membrane protein PorP/SprF [Polluticoccus soli]|uniref:type IX secretion system membrane protein PorP/SprF n=1 Tax=Polluticoccus soli TaxID=3034150 RepID=UPI0023E1E153|nr:type IX secretion system membrane protein PorP/SprF [Flavipsychrobacter sp. JY13-12]